MGLILFSLPAAASLRYAFEAPKGWQRSNFMNADEVWGSTDGSKASVAITTKRAQNPVELRKEQLPQFMAYLEKARAVSHQLFGVKNWKIQTYTLQPTPENKGVLLKIKGHYDSGVTRQRVNFSEWHYLLGTRYYQITFSQDAGPQAFDAKKIETLLRRFKPDPL